MRELVRPHSAPPVSPTSLQTTPYPPSLRIMSGHCKVSGLTTRSQHTPTDSKLTPKSLSKEFQEKHEVQTKTSYTKTYQEDKLPLGRRSQGRLGLQFTNPGTFQLLIAPMVTGRIASDLSIETLEDPRPHPPQITYPSADSGRKSRSCRGWAGCGAWLGVEPRFPSNLTCAGGSPSSQEGRSGEAQDRTSEGSAPHTLWDIPRPRLTLPSDDGSMGGVEEARILKPLPFLILPRKIPSR